MIVSTGGQCPGGSGAAVELVLLLPGILAEHGHRGYLVVTALKGAGHRTELCRLRRNITGLDGCPLRCLHSGQVSCLLDGTASGFTGFLDATAEKLAPGLPADDTKVIWNVKIHTHIHIAPDRRAMSCKSWPR